MTTEEAKQAIRTGAVVTYNGSDHFIDHIITRYDGKEKGWRNSLFLVPCNGVNSATVARMRDCELKG
jgi:hypothetical protein